MQYLGQSVLCTIALYFLAWPLFPAFIMRYKPLSHLNHHHHHHLLRAKFVINTLPLGMCQSCNSVNVYMIRYRGPGRRTRPQPGVRTVQQAWECRCGRRSVLVERVCVGLSWRCLGKDRPGLSIKNYKPLTFIPFHLSPDQPGDTNTNLVRFAGHDFCAVMQQIIKN